MSARCIFMVYSGKTEAFWCHVSLNLETAKYVYLRFSSIVWFLQFLRHFLWVLEARSKLILFYTKFWVNRARLLASKCTSLLLRSKPVQWNYRHFFLRFQTEEHVLRVKVPQYMHEPLSQLYSIWMFVFKLLYR